MSADFREKGASPTNHCWCQKTRVIAVSCGIKISAMHPLVLSQYMRLTDGHTDRQTDGWTDVQNCDSNTVHCITCSRTVKTKNRSLSHPLEDLGVTYALHLWLVGKPIVDFMFVVIELFRCLLRLKRYERKCIEVGVFRRGWVTLSADFKGKGYRPPTSVGVRRLERLLFRVVSDYLQSII